MTRAGLDALELELLDAVLERLIPSDGLGAGAREACVSRYLTRRLAGPYRHHLETYADGLHRLEAESRQRHGAGFASLGPERQDALLHAAATRSDDGDPFFELLLAHALEGMFADPSHGGNADRVGWQLIGYPGPRAVWSEADQRLGTTDP